MEIAGSICMICGQHIVLAMVVCSSFSALLLVLLSTQKYFANHENIANLVVLAWGFISTGLFFIFDVRRHLNRQENLKIPGGW